MWLENEGNKGRKLGRTKLEGPKTKEHELHLEALVHGLSKGTLRFSRNG